MAFSAAKNQNLFERARDWARQAQNLYEEGLRIINVKNQEAQGHADHDDTDIGTVAELGVLISYITDFTQFHEGDGAAAGLMIARWGWLIAFIDTTPA